MSDLDTFLKPYPISHYEKGTVIISQDTVPTGAYIIKKGVVKTYHVTARGEEKPIGFAIKNDIFPLGWIFGQLCQTQYAYEALKDSDVYTVPSDEFIAFLKHTPTTMFQVLERNISMMLCNHMRINALGQSKASDKVLYTIHCLALCYGHNLQDNIVEIPLPLTQQDIANFTGLTRETVSVELKKLTSKKAILSHHRNYVVLTDRLNELLGDEYGHRLVR